MSASQNSIDLSEAIYLTIGNMERWHDVLSLMCEMIGTKRALITTREKPSSDVVISEVIATELDSPFLHGFSPEEVDSYIDVYRDVDIWTTIENKYHPHFPYALSKHLPINELKSHKFWEWLQPQGVDDSIVAKIFETDEHWIAINIYYSFADKDMQNRIFELLAEILPIMSKAWELGFRVNCANSLLASSGQFIERYDFPALLMSPARQVIWVNGLAKELFNQDPIAAIQNKRLRFSDRNLQKWMVTKIDRLFDHTSEVVQNIIEVYEQLENYRITVSRLSGHDYFLGTNSPVWLLSIFPKDYVLQDKSVALGDHGFLTNRERELAEHLLAGHTIKSFAPYADISPHTADFHWRSLKKKLGINSRQELVRLAK